LANQAPPVERLKGFVANARISILLIPVVFGYYFIQASLGRLFFATPDPARTVVAILSMMAVGAAGAYWNSIVDIKIDRVNHPDWPLPSGILSVREVTMASVLFAVLAVALASLVGEVFLLLASTTLILAAAYSLPPFRLKTRFWLRYVSHSLIIMVFIPLTFWTVYATINGQIIATVLVLFVFRTLAWGVKDIKDIKGDARGNVITIPIKYGPRRAYELSVLALILSWTLLFVFIHEGIISSVFLTVPPIAIPAIAIVGRTLKWKRGRVAVRR